MRQHIWQIVRNPNSIHMATGIDYFELSKRIHECIFCKARKTLIGDTVISEDRVPEDCDLAIVHRIHEQ